MIDILTIDKKTPKKSQLMWDKPSIYPSVKKIIFESSAMSDRI